MTRKVVLIAISSFFAFNRHIQVSERSFLLFLSIRFVRRADSEVSFRTQSLLALLLVAAAVVLHVHARPYEDQNMVFRVDLPRSLPRSQSASCSTAQDRLETLSLINTFGTFFIGQFLFIEG
jgi:hypothetical protein